MEKIIGAKFSVERRPEYRQVTVIAEEDGIRTARKLPAEDAARAHIQGYAQNRTRLEKSLLPGHRIDLVDCREENGEAVFPFLTEETLADRLADCSVDGYVKTVQDFLEAVKASFPFEPFRQTDEFNLWFGTAEVPGQEQSLQVTNPDMNFDNLFCTDSGRYIMIDYEWVFSFPIPFRYVLYRALMIDAAFNSFSEEEQATIFRSLGIAEESKAVFRQMEEHFIRRISPDEYRLFTLEKIRQDGENRELMTFERMEAVLAENRNLLEEIGPYRAIKNNPIVKPVSKALHSIRAGKRKKPD